MKKRSIIISALAVITAAIGGIVIYRKRRGY
jgi:glucose uptake protein GlcU